jgi:phosphoribosylformylglycinamidine synthase
VVSGNVSLYNEHSGTPIHPTPVVGAVGVLERADLAVPAFPSGEDVVIHLIGDAVPAHDGSERQALEDGAVSGRIPDVDLAAIGRLAQLLASAADEGVLASAHEASDGGLAVALAEVCLGAACGCELDVPLLAGTGELTLFGEVCGLVVVGCDTADSERLASLCAGLGVRERRLGELRGGDIVVRCGETALATALDDARAAYESTLPEAMDALPERA